MLQDDQPFPEGYFHVSYHLNFDVKVDLHRKSYLVDDGYCSPPVFKFKEDYFAPTVSLESVFLGFLLAQMRGLKCVVADIGNVYLNVFTAEELYIVAGNNFNREEVRTYFLSVLYLHVESM